MNFADLAARIDLPIDTFMELAELYLSSTASGLTRIRDGVAKRSSDDISSGAHEIKGASANLGFSGATELSSAIELNADENPEMLSPLINDLAEAIEEIRTAISAHRKAE